MCPDQEPNPQPFGAGDNAPIDWAPGQGKADFCFSIFTNNIILKLYIIDYAITVVLIFPPLLLLHLATPTSSGNPLTIVGVHGSCI